jgi:hypothetical protein
MNYLRQEKSLRDHESYLRGLAAIADRVVAHQGTATGELLTLPEAGPGSRWRRGDVRRQESYLPGFAGTALGLIAVSVAMATETAIK